MNKHYITRIYDLCIAGLPASKISKILRRDKGQISRIINSLIDNGFLVCVNPRDKVRFYEATKKSFTDKAISTVSTIQQKVKVSTDERGSFCRVHAIRFISTVVKMGKVSWDKKWVCKGTEHYFVNYPFSNVGNVSFEWVRSKRSSQLLIHVPSFWWDMRNGDPGLLLREVADRAGTWFMKRYHCDIRGLRQCGKGHFEVPVRDKKLVELAQAKSIKVDGFVLDSSLGFPEFGSVEGFGPLEELFGLIPRVNTLECEVAVLRESIGGVTSSIRELKVSIDELKDLLKRPVLPDDYRDVT